MTADVPRVPRRRTDRTTCASRTSRAASTTARSRCRSRAACSSRSRARATRRCCSGLARSLRPAYDWFFPYYRDRALMLALGRHADRDPLSRPSAPRSTRPQAGGRCRATGAPRHLNVVSQTSATGTQCIPAVGSAEAARYIVRRPGLGLPAHGDELTYVSLGEGATSEGEFWESLNTACTEHLPVLYVVADNGFAISVPASEQSPAPVAELVTGFRGLAVHKFDGRDYFEARQRGAEAIAHVRAGVGPALIHATVTRPYSHSAADTQSKYRSADELADESGARSDHAARSHARRRWRAVTRRGAGVARRSVPGRRRRGEGGDGGAAARSVDHRAPREGSARARGARLRPDTEGGRRRAVRRSDQAHAARGDGQATSASASSAKTSATPAKTCSKTSRARAACSARRTACNASSGAPVATTRRWRKPTSSGAPSVRRFAV